MRPVYPGMPGLAMIEPIRSIVRNGGGMRFADSDALILFPDSNEGATVARAVVVGPIADVRFGVNSDLQTLYIRFHDLRQAGRFGVIRHNENNPHALTSNGQKCMVIFPSCSRTIAEIVEDWSLRLQAGDVEDLRRP